MTRRRIRVAGMAMASAALAIVTGGAPAASPRREEPWRPAYHFTPATQWMNDPNGLVYADGIYHLFYQFHPGSTAWGPMHWGHAVSRDLIHWQDRPVALAPDRLGMVFSGSAVVDRSGRLGRSHDGRPALVAMFTHHDEALKRAGGDAESQGLAISTDGGTTWTRYPGNPVLRPAPGQRDFRDPKLVWYAPGRRWIATLAAGSHVEFYGSSDLVHWTWLSRFATAPVAGEGVWECPDLLPLRVAGSRRTRWVLLHSINPGGPNGGSATRYLVGDFDGTRFTPDPQFARAVAAQGPRWLDWGRDSYAGVTWSGLPGADRRALMIGWMSNWDYADRVPTGSWRGAMTLPRELTLHPDPASGYALRVRPLPGLRSLEGPAIRLRRQSVTGELPVPMPAHAVGQAVLDLAFTLPPGTSAAGLTLSNTAGDTYRFTYDATQQRYVSDRTRAGLADFAPTFASVDTAPRLTRAPVVRLIVYIDRSSIEVFADGGRSALTSLVFPRSPYSRLSFFAVGGPAQLLTLRAAPLRRATGPSR